MKKFQQFGTVDKVSFTTGTNFAFIKYAKVDEAAVALEETNRMEVNHVEVSVVFCVEQVTESGNRL
jgi:hypothetical protein